MNDFSYHEAYDGRVFKKTFQPKIPERVDQFPL